MDNLPRKSVLWFMVGLGIKQSADFIQIQKSPA